MDEIQEDTEGFEFPFSTLRNYPLCVLGKSQTGSGGSERSMYCERSECEWEVRSGLFTEVTRTR